MKQKLIAALVTSAIAGLAAPTANAGVIQATYKIYAAEAFGADSVALTVPTVSYNLSRPISGTLANPNNFKITLTLSSGEWGALPNAQLRDPSNVQQLDGTNPTLSGDKKSVTFDFTANDGFTYPANSTITFGNVTVGTVLKVDSILKTPLDNACAPTQAQVTATVQMTNASGVEVDTNDPGAIVTTPVLASNVALNVSAISSSVATWDNDGLPATAEVVIESSKIDVLTTGLGKKFTAGDATDATGGPAIINLGKVVIKDRASLFDIDGASNYSVANPLGGGVSGDGQVSAETLKLVIGGKFVADSNADVYLSKSASCATADLSVADETATINSAGDQATFATTIANADWAGTAVRSAYVCYKTDGSKVIPTAQFKLLSGSLTKVGASNELANPVCPANLYNLVSNGVQLDVRNYIQKAQTDATGWVSVLRIINTDETQTVDVNAQLIRDDGTLLNAGKIVTLAPRAFKYMTAAEIEAQLPETVGASGNNARLRLTAAGSSLRVQNYHLNPVTGAVNEVSAAQGDDGPDYARKADGDNK